MQFETSTDIDAAPGDVWMVLTDVERWPQWTTSMTSVQRLDEGPFAVGSRARVRQPRLPAAVWEVVDLEPERSFSWTARAPGITTTAEHRLTPRLGGGVGVTLSIGQRGPLSPLVALLTSRITRRYVHMEAEGLKRRCENFPER
jgi:uncharacterized protein YndB with AHSA1/START domain